MATDCNDRNPSINPGAIERGYDGIDNDCNPDTPDVDLDGDGVGYGDCDDRDPEVYPGNVEIPYDGVDNDCDDSTPDDDVDGQERQQAQ